MSQSSDINMPTGPEDDNQSPLKTVIESIFVLVFFIWAVASVIKYIWFTNFIIETAIMLSTFSIIGYVLYYWFFDKDDECIKPEM